MIHNTHYNLIDTYILAFGFDFWKELTYILFRGMESAVKRNPDMGEYIEKNFHKGISLNPEGHRYYSEKLMEYISWDDLDGLDEEIMKRKIDFHNQHQFTICELFMWAMTEGRISKYWGHGFKFDTSYL